MVRKLRGWPLRPFGYFGNMPSVLYILTRIFLVDKATQKTDIVEIQPPPRHWIMLEPVRGVEPRELALEALIGYVESEPREHQEERRAKERAPDPASRKADNNAYAGENHEYDEEPNIPIAPGVQYFDRLTVLIELPQLFPFHEDHSISPDERWCSVIGPPRGV